MIALTGTSYQIQLVTGGTQAVDVTATWVDKVVSAAAVPTGGIGPNDGVLNTLITTATTATVVPSPALGHVLEVQSISIRNTDPSTPVMITVQVTDGTNVVPEIKVSLPAQYSLQYEAGNGWIQIDAGGGRIETPLTGRILKQTPLSSASGSFTVGPTTNTIYIEGVGGGGAGGGCTSVASAAGAAGGGQSGGYLEKLVAVTPGATYSYTCGAGGAGVSGAAGGNGAASTFVVGSTTYTAGPGGGAAVAVSSTNPSANPGGVGGANSTNGDVNKVGEPGQPGILSTVAGAIGCSGVGGSTIFGTGGNPAIAVGSGGGASGYGGGGGGALTGASAAQAGGAGTGGFWLVKEYS